MRRAHDRGPVAKPLKYYAPRPAGLAGIVICHHAKLGVFPLQRRMNHISSDKRIRSSSSDQHREVINGMAGRRDKLNPIVEIKVALHDFRALGLNDRQYRVSYPRHAFWIVLLPLLPMGKLANRDDLGGLRKGRHPAPIFEPR